MERATTLTLTSTGMKPSQLISIFLGSLFLGRIHFSDYFKYIETLSIICIVYLVFKVAKDSPSDDSGVEVNGSGNYDTHLMDR